MVMGSEHPRSWASQPFLDVIAVFLMGLNCTTMDTDVATVSPLVSPSYYGYNGITLLKRSKHIVTTLAIMMVYL